MITLQEASENIGAGVVYQRPYCPPEQGTIVGTSSRSVFVLYQGDMAPKGTNPEDLEWLSPLRLPTPIVCWRSECRTGCYYPDVCSERKTQ